MIYFGHNIAVDTFVLFRSRVYYHCKMWKSVNKEWVSDPKLVKGSILYVYKSQIYFSSPTLSSTTQHNVKCAAVHLYMDLTESKQSNPGEWWRDLWASWFQYRLLAGLRTDRLNWSNVSLSDQDCWDRWKCDCTTRDKK